MRVTGTAQTLFQGLRVQRSGSNSWTSYTCIQIYIIHNIYIYTHAYRMYIFVYIDIHIYIYVYVFIHMVCAYMSLCNTYMCVLLFRAWLSSSDVHGFGVGSFEVIASTCVSWLFISPIKYVCIFPTKSLE